MTRKRSSYRPGRIVVNPIQYAIAGARVMSLAKQNQLQVLELRALAAFQSGDCEEADLDTLAGVAEMAQTLARRGIGIELLEICARAKTALDAARARFERHGRIGRAAGEHETFAELLELHHIQRQSVALSEYETALRHTFHRLGKAVPA